MSFEPQISTQVPTGFLLRGPPTPMKRPRVAPETGALIQPIPSESTASAQDFACFQTDKNTFRGRRAASGARAPPLISVPHLMAQNGRFLATKVLHSALTESNRAFIAPQYSLNRTLTEAYQGLNIAVTEPYSAAERGYYFVYYFFSRCIFFFH